MTALANIPSKPLAPPPADPMLMRSISSLIRFTPDDGRPPELREAPSHGLSQACQRRIVELDTALRQDAETARKAVAALLVLYPRRPGEDEAALVVAGYLAALRGLPALAVQMACGAWARGEAKDQRKGWAPTPDELRGAAVAAIEPYRIERMKLAAFLNARHPPPRIEKTADERAAIADRLTAGIVTPPTPKPATLTGKDAMDADAQLARRAEALDWGQPIEVSDELATQAEIQAA